MTTLDYSDPRAIAEAWLDADPDPRTRAEIAEMLDGDAQVLSDRFARHLDFGTAGLRGRLGAGPNRMNRVLVRLVASAIAEELSGETDPHVVIGYDARHGSHLFAVDTARVLLARGVRCTTLPYALPTPVLSFAVRSLDASAGVMVTASHNPRDDNGYKVYWRGGALLTSPLDQSIAAAIRRTPFLHDSDLAPESDPRLTPVPEQLVADYLAAIGRGLDPSGSRSARAVHTALHGVGTEMATRAFADAGFPALITVEDQAEPDPDFPTTPFPNPEEPGTLDLLLALGDSVGADVALANDPDADRLAVAIPTAMGWQNLTGDDVGCLLADHLLRRPAEDDRTPLVISTTVSSRLLARIAASYGADHAETLTGFKWIMAARAAHPEHRFVCGYEEALGYAVNDVVPDKDGVSAALVIGELVSGLKDQGLTLLDRLDELHGTHGVHATGQRAIRFETSTVRASSQRQTMDWLRAHPPITLAGADVQAVRDLAAGETGLPPTNGLVLELADARLVIRPSGTEPKMKIYGEVISAPTTDVATVRAEARATLRRLLDAAVKLVTSFDLPPTDLDEGPDPRLGEVFARRSTGRARVDDLSLIVRCIDLTTLEGNDTAAKVRALCAQARRPDVSNPTVGPVAAVCVYPELISLVAELTSGTTIAAASVAGAFPTGLSALDVRLADIESAVLSGADEVDIVLNRSAMLQGHVEQVAHELEASRAAAGDAHLKVILEVGELDGAQISAAARLAMDAGADFIKTSTGKSAVSATPDAVWLMAEAIRSYADETGRKVGLKIAGGVRSADDALAYLSIVREILGDAWLTPDLFRFGASSLLDAVVAELDTART